MLSVRIRTRLRCKQLDEELAHGADPNGGSGPDLRAALREAHAALDVPGEPTQELAGAA